MDAAEVLTTTRSVRRKLDLDRPVEPEVLTECLRIAQQAPAAGRWQRISGGWSCVTRCCERGSLSRFAS